LADRTLVSMRGRSRLAGIVGGLLLLSVAGLSAATLSQHTRSSDGSVAPSNFVFYYQQIDPTVDAAKFQGATAVVTAGQRDDAAAVAAIHKAGALAIKYVQFYWFPAGRVYEGFDIGNHLDWSFCDRMKQPLPGKLTEAGEQWYFFDANEEAARHALFKYLATVRGFGYDGIFFDRGSPSLRSSAGRSVAWRTSTCTRHPVSTTHRRFADVFTSVVEQAKDSLGFRVFLNYGHPFSGVRMRPDPTDPACRRHGHIGCRYLDDLSHTLSGVVDESAGDLNTTLGFAHEFRLDQAESLGDKAGTVAVIRGIKAPAGGRTEAYYRWATVRLFGLSTFINTGDDGCPVTRCDRNGIYSELTHLNLGAPIGDDPRASHCMDGRSLRCLWQRSYAGGVVLVNSSDRRIRSTLTVAASACRFVNDLYSGTWSTDCIRNLGVDVPPHRGLVFGYTSSR
jgi:hypothetical protein